MSPQPIDLLVVDARVATMVGAGDDAFGLVEDGAVAVAKGRIHAVLTAGEVAGARGRAAQVWSAGGRLVTPGLIDCHTHLVFGGDRRAEFELRAAGASYEELAAAGGGILSTVGATRKASDDDLLRSAALRLSRLTDGGVTTVEVKSGYGLDPESELRILRVIRELADGVPVDVVPTVLALHSLPPEYRDRRDDYLDVVCDELLPAVAAESLAVAVDAFCDRIAFTANEVDRLLFRASELGLRVKLHADQLSDSGGAELAARHRALSADHLEHASAAGIEAMARAGTVAVLLPGATVTLRETSRPPVDALRDARVPMAVSTDANPGSSPLLSLLVAAHLSCSVLGLSATEAFAGITSNAAMALGIPDAGSLRPGARADFAAWDAEHPAELVYWCAGHAPVAVAHRGAVIGELP